VTSGQDVAAVDPDEVIGVALIHVWIRFGSPDRLEIRLVAADAGGDRPIGVATTFSGATALVQEWLEGLTRRSEPPVGRGADNGKQA
jgi:hypothetical protein